MKWTRPGVAFVPVGFFSAVNRSQKGENEEVFVW